MIYAEVLQHDHQIQITGSAPSRIQAIRSTDDRTLQLGLLFANRQISSEAASFFYGNNTFGLVNSSQLLYFLKRIGSSAARVSHISVLLYASRYQTYYGEAAFRVLANARRLESLTVSAYMWREHSNFKNKDALLTALMPVFRALQERNKDLGIVNFSPCRCVCGSRVHVYDLSCENHRARYDSFVADVYAEVNARLKKPPRKRATRKPRAPIASSHRKLRPRPSQV